MNIENIQKAVRVANDIVHALNQQYGSDDWDNTIGFYIRKASYIIGHVDDIVTRLNVQNEDKRPGLKDNDIQF